MYSGWKYLAMSLEITLDVCGANSDGLIIVQFPAAIAPINGVITN